MNAIRLFLYEKMNRFGLSSDINENPVLWREVATCCVAGSIAAMISSPLYLVKIQTQSQAHPDIAVGWQHPHHKARWGLWNVMRGSRGYPSMFAGGTSAVLRMSVASTVQLFCFTNLQPIVADYGYKNCVSNSCVTSIFLLHSSNFA